MKKIFSILFLLAFTFTVSAQSTSPRFGTLKNQDNTGRGLTYKLVSVTDGTGADSVIAFPGAYKTYYKVTLIDSLAFKQPVVTTSYLGDNIVIVATGASGTKVKFTGSNWITTGTATLSSGGRAIIDLIFDGARWVESNRTVQ